MQRHVTRGNWFLIVFIVIVAALITGGILLFIFSGHKKDIGACTEYKCDVKSVQMIKHTAIDVWKNDEKFVTVKGDLFTFLTDPLTMKALDGKQLGYAGDEYKLFNQDAHPIFVEGEARVDMVGQFNISGDSYDIYDANQKKIAHVRFNHLNTHGEMVDTEGNLMADYTSRWMFKDFDVRIVDGCELDEKVILMIFCSYYSDQEADRSK